jgi:5-methylcytosine-specific restriction endonuclease McrA
MSLFPRPCSRCGARVDAGGSCPRCSGASHASSCRECGALTAGGPYCGAHLPLAGEAGRLVRQPYRAHYSDPVYRWNRQRRYELAGGCCETCGDQLADSWECDHVVTLRDGGTNAVENLRVSCGRCHKAKTRTDRRRRRGA